MLNEEIYKFAHQNNLIVGVCDAEKLDIKERLAKTQTPFVTYDIEQRLDPKKTLATAKSIIVVGMGYNKKLDFKFDNIPRGIISVGAVGIDYHILLKELLTDLVSRLEKYKKFEYKIFVDNGPLYERELGKKAGLGFYGRNCNIISDKFGSFFYIGYIIADLDLQLSDEVIDKLELCNSCGKCIEACPGNALSTTEIKCDYRKCASYLTQKKEELTEEEMKIIGINIYGCDICKNVCPYNNNTYIDKVYNIDEARPDLNFLINMTKSHFNNTLKKTSAGWRGLKIIKRNAYIALKNYKLP